jgi:hypothetical protein
VYKLLSKEVDVTFARQQLPTVAGSSNIYGMPLQQLAPATAAGSTSFDTSKSSTTSSSSSKRSRSSGLTDVHAVITTPEASASMATASSASAGFFTVHLKPEPLEFSPVQYGIINIDQQSSSTTSSSKQPIAAVQQQPSRLQQQTRAVAPAGAGNSSSTGGTATGMPGVAYLKLLSFSETAPQQVAEALIDMQQLKPRQQSQQLQQQQNMAEGQTELQPRPLIGLVLDLRDNVGGIVEAGVDIAQDFLHADQILCIAVDRSNQEERVVLPSAHTLTNLPLVSPG